MNIRRNPFIRGFQDLTVRRVLLIDQKLSRSPCSRVLHPSQEHLPDGEVQSSTCIFNETFALIVNRQHIADALAAQCRCKGTVLKSIHSIYASDFGIPIHVGDTYSRGSAQFLLKRLAFEFSRYSRCWEINSGHLPIAALNYLERLAESGIATGLLFEPFRAPVSRAIGCKLFWTPWTDENLKHTDDKSATELRQEHLRAGVPEALVNVLHLAALADTRVLIFDPDAAELDGLPFYPR